MSIYLPLLKTNKHFICGEFPSQTPFATPTPPTQKSPQAVARLRPPSNPMSIGQAPSMSMRKVRLFLSCGNLFHVFAARERIKYQPIYEPRPAVIIALA